MIDNPEGSCYAIPRFPPFGRMVRKNFLSPKLPWQHATDRFWSEKHMARKTPSRLELRKMAEAAAAQGEGESATKKTKKKRATARKTTTRTKRTKAVAQQRKRLMWGVFNGSMKEEARFPYDQREAAEEKLEQLRSKGKKLYFIQPIKEEITEPVPAAAETAEE